MATVYSYKGMKLPPSRTAFMTLLDVFFWFLIPSNIADCFAHIGKNASGKGIPYILSYFKEFTLCLGFVLKFAFHCAILCQY